MSAEPRCRTCGAAIYFKGKTDHVGRQTSEGEYVHFDASADHKAVPS